MGRMMVADEPPSGRVLPELQLQRSESSPANHHPSSPRHNLTFLGIVVQCSVEVSSNMSIVLRPLVDGIDATWTVSRRPIIGAEANRWDCGFDEEQSMLRLGFRATLIHITVLLASILIGADSVALAMYEQNRYMATSPTLSHGNISDTKYVEVLSIIEIAPLPDRLYLDQRTALRCAKERLGKTLQDDEKELDHLRQELRELRQSNRGTRPGEEGPTRAEQDEWRTRVSSLNAKIRDLRSAIRLTRAEFHRTDRELKELDLTGGSALLLRLWDGFNHQQITAYFLDTDMRNRRLLQEGAVYEVEGFRRAGIRFKCNSRDRAHEPWHWNELATVNRLRNLPNGFWPAGMRDDLVIPILASLDDTSIFSVEVRPSKDPHVSRLEVLLHVANDDPAEARVHVYANDVDGNRDTLLTTTGPLIMTRGPAGGSVLQTAFDPGTRHPFGYSVFITHMKVWRSKEFTTTEVSD